MSDFQKSFSESTSSIKFDEKYIDTSVQPNDIGVAEQWAVKTVADPCVGNLATPVNSGYFTKAFINNLPFYREGISPNFRGLETGAAFGYLLYGPFTMTGPLRNSEFLSGPVIVKGPYRRYPKAAPVSKPLKLGEIPSL